MVKGFLEKAIELNDKDVFAWEQLGRLHVQVRGGEKFVGCEAQRNGTERNGTTWLL